MTIQSMRDSYSFCEPMLDRNGRIIFATLTHGKIDVNVTQMEELQNKDELPLFSNYRNVSMNGWELPGNFTRGLKWSEIGNHTETVPEAIRNVAKKIEDILDRSIFFIDGRYATICTLFIITSYFIKELPCAPRLIIEGVTSSGKGRLDSILSELCYHGCSAGDSSYASTMRFISEFDITPILSEYMDIKIAEREQFNRLLKVGFDTHGKSIRCDGGDSNYKPATYRNYAPIAIDIKAADTLAEDVLNRSFRLTMIENIGMKRIDRQLDMKMLSEIRTDLYRMKLLYEIRKITDRERMEMFRLDSYLGECSGILQNIDGFGNIVPTEGSGISPGTPEILNRSYDIASAYYPFARIIGKVDDLMSMLTSSQRGIRSRVRLTKEAVIFSTWVISALDMFPKTFRNFLDSALGQSTKDIKELFLDNIRNEGNDGDEYRNITTNSIGNSLRSLGFKTSYDHMPGHQTFVVKTDNIEDLFKINVSKLCDEITAKKFFSLEFTKRERTEPDGKNVSSFGKNGGPE